MTRKRKLFKGRVLAPVLALALVMGITPVNTTMTVQAADQRDDIKAAALGNGTPNITLTSDCEMDTPIRVTPSVDMTINLNGYTLKLKPDGDNAGIIVQGTQTGEASLVISDSTSGSDTPVGRVVLPATVGTTNPYTAVQVGDGGTFEFNGGKLEGPKKELKHNGVTVSGGTFKMGGKAIITEFDSAIVSADTGAATYRLSGGEITGNNRGISASKYPNITFANDIQIINNVITNVELITSNPNALVFESLYGTANIALSFDSENLSGRFLNAGERIVVSKNEVDSSYFQFIKPEGITVDGTKLDIFTLENAEVEGSRRMILRSKLSYNSTDPMVGTKTPVYVYSPIGKNPTYQTMASYTSANPAKVNEWTTIFNQDGTGYINLSGYNQSTAQQRYNMNWYNYSNGYIIYVSPTDVTGGLVFYMKQNEDANAYSILDGDARVFFQKPGAPDFNPEPKPPTPVEPTEAIPLVGNAYSSVSGTIDSTGNFKVAQITNDMLAGTKGASSLTKTLTFDLTAVKNTEVTAIEIPKESITALSSFVKNAQNGFDDVEFKFNSASMQMVPSVLDSFQSQATGTSVKFNVSSKSLYSLDSVEASHISTLNAINAYDFSVESDSKAIPTFSGKIRMNLGFTPQSGRSPAYYHVFSISKTAAPTREATYYKNGKLMFDATHFSTYVVAYNSSIVNESDNNVVRLYNPIGGDHILSCNVAERVMLKNSGWTEEGLAFYTAVAGDTIYRLYNPGYADHLYTPSQKEVDACLAYGGWQLEGIAFKSAGGTPVYRLYHAKIGKHHFTNNQTEANFLIQNGWTSEGIGFHAD